MNFRVCWTWLLLSFLTAVKLFFNDHRIWDRVIGCHAPMCVYIALATLCTFRHVLVPMRTRDSVQGFLSKVCNECVMHCIRGLHGFTAACSWLRLIACAQAIVQFAWAAHVGACRQALAIAPTCPIACERRGRRAA